MTKLSAAEQAALDRSTVNAINAAVNDLNSALGKAAALGLHVEISVVSERARVGRPVDRMLVGGVIVERRIRIEP